MTLLCAKHNEQKKKRLLSVADVLHFKANPFTLGQRYSQFHFVQPREPLLFQIPGVRFETPMDAIRCGGKRVLNMTGGRSTDEPFLIRARITNEFGRVVCRIVDNEMRFFGGELADLDQVQSSFKMTYAQKTVSDLEFEFLPEEKLVKFAKLKHYDKGCAILAEGDSCRVYSGSLKQTFRNIGLTRMACGIELIRARRLYIDVADRNGHGGMENILLDGNNSAGIGIRVAG